VTASASAIEGRAWLFAEPNINTDLIMPAVAFRLPREEQVKLIFSAVRPGWTELVRRGDILVGGRNFGTGSSRPGSELLKLLGIGGLVADSINDLFYRNCVNYALPALECPGASGLVEEGDPVRLDARAGTFQNLRTGAELRGPAMPEMLWQIIEAGGLFERLRKEGYI
jgi:3-isopropylmalate/(R)-2-methylmalate dehydratase small subunit